MSIASKFDNIKSQKITNELVWDLIESIFDNQERFIIKGEKYIFELKKLRSNINDKNLQMELLILEANLREEHESGQTVWETIAGGLVINSTDERIYSIVNGLEKEHIAFADEMERIAEQVKQKEIPREAFDRLLLALEDKNDPNQFDLALKILNQ